jgi:two-component system response regulator FixJ
MLSASGDKTRRKRLAQERVALLTTREREVLQGLVAGLSNKMLARRLGISLRTVEMHRANMMERLQVGSLAEALTLAVQAEIAPMHEIRTQPAMATYPALVRLGL